MYWLIAVAKVLNWVALKVCSAPEASGHGFVVWPFVKLPFVRIETTSLLMLNCAALSTAYVPLRMLVAVEVITSPADRTPPYCAACCWFET